MKTITRSRRSLALISLCIFLNATMAPVAMAATGDSEPLSVRNKFLGGTQFSIAGNEEQAAFGFFGSLSPEFETLLSSNQRALKLAKSSASLAKTGAWSSLTLAVIGGWKNGVKTANETSNPGESGGSGGTMYLISAIGASLLFGSMSKSKLDESVRVFNGEDIDTVDAVHEDIISAVESTPCGVDIRGETLVEYQVLSW